MRGGVDVRLIVAGNFSHGVDAERKDKLHARETEGGKGAVGTPDESVKDAMQVNIEASNTSRIVDAVGNDASRARHRRECRDGAVRSAQEPVGIVERAVLSRNLACRVNARGQTILSGPSEESGNSAVYRPHEAVIHQDGVLVEACNHSRRVDAAGPCKDRSTRIETGYRAIGLSHEAMTRRAIGVKIETSNRAGSIQAYRLGEGRSRRVEGDETSICGTQESVQHLVRGKVSRYRSCRVDARRCSASAARR